MTPAPKFGTHSTHSLMAEFRRAARDLTKRDAEPPSTTTTRSRGGADSLRLSVSQLTADYIALCHNPMAQLSRWLDEPRPKSFSGSVVRISERGKHHDQSQSTSEPMGNTNRLRAHPLHQVQGGLDALRRGGSRHSLSARSRAGVAQYDELRSVRAEGQQAGLVGSNVAESPPDFSSEFAAVQSQFASRIAAARVSLSSRDAAATIRRLLDEQTIAMRAVSERQQLASRLRLERPFPPSLS